MDIEAKYEEVVFGPIGEVKVNEGTMVKIGDRLYTLREAALTLLDAVESLRLAPKGDLPATELSDEVRRFETDLIRAALERTGGNQARAARLLGVKHTTLNAKIKKYRITLTEERALPLRTLGFTGMWSDRADIEDGLDYVNKLRASRRP